MTWSEVTCDNTDISPSDSVTWLTSSPVSWTTVAPKVRTKVTHRKAELELQSPKKWMRNPRAVYERIMMKAEMKSRACDERSELETAPKLTAEIAPK